MKPGYREIYQRYRQNIHDGVLKPGDRVPSIRLLAQELQVAKKTVEAAYAVLVGEGYLVSRGPQGTCVNPALTSVPRLADNALSPSTRAARSLAKARAICAPAFRRWTAFPTRNGCCCAPARRAPCARKRWSTRRSRAMRRCARPSPAT